MRQAAVGQKCPRCAAVPRGARALGKPRHYAKGGGAGLAVAVLGGIALRLLLGAVGFGAILLPALLGFGIGRAVRWGAAAQSSQPFVVMAAVLGALGGVVTAGGPLVFARPFGLLGVAAAAWFAVRGLRG